MGKNDYVGTIRDGIGLVGKLAAKSVGHLSRQLMSEEKSGESSPKTGLYFRRTILAEKEEISPRIEFLERDNWLKSGGSFKNLIRGPKEKIFAKACYALLVGEEKSALKSLKEAIALDPRFCDAYFLSGALNLSRGDFAAAQENFSRARLLPSGLGEELKKFLPSFHMSAGITENLSFDFFPDDIGLGLLQAIAWRKGKNLARAIETLENMLAVIPASEEISLFLSAFYFEAGWNDRIIHLWGKTAFSGNLTAVGAQFTAMAWIMKKNFTLAEGILNRIIEDESLESYLIADAKMLLAQIAENSSRPAEAAALTNWVKKRFSNYKPLEQRLGLKIMKDFLPEPKNLPIYDIKQKNSKETEPGDMKAEKPINTDFAEDEQTMEIENIFVEAGYMEEDEDDEEEEGGYEDDSEESEGRLEPGEVILVCEDGEIDDTPIGDSLTIGREEGDISIPWDESVSRVHTRIFLYKGQVWVEDLDSTNGTFINQHRIIGRRVLNRGDRLLVGRTEFYIE